MYPVPGCHRVPVILGSGGIPGSRKDLPRVPSGLALPISQALSRRKSLFCWGHLNMRTLRERLPKVMGCDAPHILERGFTAGRLFRSQTEAFFSSNACRGHGFLRALARPPEPSFRFSVVVLSRLRYFKEQVLAGIAARIVLLASPKVGHCKVRLLLAPAALATFLATRALNRGVVSIIENMIRNSSAVDRGHFYSDGSSAIHLRLSGHRRDGPLFGYPASDIVASGSQAVVELVTARFAGP